VGVKTGHISDAGGFYPPILLFSQTLALGCFWVCASPCCRSVASIAVGRYLACYSVTGHQGVGFAFSLSGRLGSPVSATVAGAWRRYCKTGGKTACKPFAPKMRQSFFSLGPWPAGFQCPWLEVV
jgi:hypothetical protein